jgi:hypothetical protein
MFFPQVSYVLVLTLFPNMARELPPENVGEATKATL